MLKKKWTDKSLVLTIKQTVMKNYVKDKVIIITGAGSGFGKLVAEMTSELGAKVVAADINADSLKEVVAGINGKGKIAEYIVTDVTNKEQMDAMAQFAVDKFGQIDVMINNAGIMPLAFYADHKIAWKAWDKCIDINFKGIVYGISAVHDQMISQGRGQVINISSIYGNFPIAGSGVYSATKAAVNVLSESLRVESQGKIKVTTIKPTGVPGTGLMASIINQKGLVGILGQNEQSFMSTFEQYSTGKLPAEKADFESPEYWVIDPEHLARNVVYAIDQPWGVSVSDITVRATGEAFIL